MRRITALIRREHGQAMIDYAFILSLVSIAGVVALSGIGSKVIAFFESVVFPQ